MKCRSTFERYPFRGTHPTEPNYVNNYYSITIKSIFYFSVIHDNCNFKNMSHYFYIENYNNVYLPVHISQSNNIKP